MVRKLTVAVVAILASMAFFGAAFAAETTGADWRLCRIDDERPGCEAKFGPSNQQIQAGGGDGAAGATGGDAGAGSSGSSGTGGNGDGCSK